jgi:chemosensory pili system protein ChpB (putative protein-glutamate methylesterase)
VCPEGGSLKFIATTAGTAPKALVAALTPSDSAVLMLSGANVELVADVLSLAEQGALVAGQDADGCYDPAAALLLGQHGKAVAEPAQLAQLLTQRWAC